MVESIFSILDRAKKTVPVDLYKLCDDLGIQLEVTNLSEHDECGYIKYCNENCKIVVDASSSKNRQRFTIAHELGHFFLHRDILEASSSKRLNRNTTGSAHNDYMNKVQETQANKFAAELLVPTDKLIEYSDKLNGDTTDLARIFEVSEQAMDIRKRSIRR